MSTTICFDDALIRYTGRFGKTAEGMTTTATGSYFELAFCGDMLLLQFGFTDVKEPAPHLYIGVSDAPGVEPPLQIESAVTPYVRVKAQGSGVHYVRVLVKSAVEHYHRFYHPLEGRVTLISATADAFRPLPADERKTVEFIGDSITEGVLTDEALRFCRERDVLNRSYQDDVTATYAYLTASALGLRPYFMGYGAVGLTHGGSGSVPRVAEAYPFCFAGVRTAYPSPDYIVINHGANDRGASAERYTSLYAEFLDLVRHMHPTSTVVVLSAFCGAHHEALGQMVDAYNAEKGSHVIFIDSFGWIPAEPLHPGRDGHKTVAEHLTAALIAKLGRDAF